MDPNHAQDLWDRLKRLRREQHYHFGLVQIGEVWQAEAYRQGQPPAFGRGPSREEALANLLIALGAWPVASPAAGDA